MVTRLGFAVVLIFSLFLCGCGIHYYSANKQITPLLKKKGDSYIEGYGGGIASGGIGAVAIDTSIGAVVSYSSFDQGVERERANHTGGLFEIGGGYWTTFRDRIAFESYGIAGYGYLDARSIDQGSAGSSVDPDTSYCRSDVFRFSIQNNLGIYWDYLEIVGGLRVSYLSYFNIDEYNNHEHPRLAEMPNNFLIENSFGLRTGWKRFKVGLQYQYSKNISHPKMPIIESQAYLSISIFFNTD